MPATVQQLYPAGAGADLSWQACLANFDANLNHAPAANTAAVVTVTADANHSHILKQIFLSYSGTPTGGSIKIEDGAGNTVWGPFAVTTSGIQVIIIDPPLAGTRNTALVVTLAAGGVGVSGVLALNAYTEK